MFIDIGEHYDAGFLLSLTIDDDPVYLTHIKSRRAVLDLLAALGVDAGEGKANA